MSTTTTIEAVYEQGVLRLARPIDLADGTRVDVTITPREQAAPQDPSAPRKKTPAEIVAEIAAMANPSEHPTDDARRHDEILYGWKKPR
jgi:predicted DNA-binding antitoxin AbrB/MazE fold protein